MVVTHLSVVCGGDAAGPRPQGCASRACERDSATLLCVSYMRVGSAGVAGPSCVSVAVRCAFAFLWG